MKINLSAFFFLLNLSTLVLGQSTCSLKIRINNTDVSGTQRLTVCKGSTVLIQAEQIKNAEYQWYRNNIAVKDSTKATFTVNDTGEYSVTAKTQNCLHMGGNVDVKVVTTAGIFNISKSGDNASRFLNADEYTFCSTITLYVNNSPSMSYGQSTFTWQKNGIDILTTEESSAIFNEEGTYSVRAKIGNCESSSKAFVLKKVSKNENKKFAYYNLNSLVEGDTLNICEGNRVRLSSASASWGQVKWYKDDKQLPELGSNLFATEMGNYKAKYTDFSGCETEESVFVKVHKILPNPNLISYIRTDVVTCNESFLSLPNDFLYNLRSSGDDIVGYELYKNQKLISSSKSWQTYNLRFAYNNTEDAVYQLKIFPSRGCSIISNDFRNILPIQKPVYKLLRNAPNSKVVNIACPNNSISLEASTYYSSGTTTEWYRDGVLVREDRFGISIFEATTSGKYHAIMRFFTGCVAYSDTVQVIAQPQINTKISESLTSECQKKLIANKIEGAIYAWKKDGEIIRNSNSPELTVGQVGDYTVVINKGTCSYESNKIVFGAGINTNRITGKKTFCVGDSLKLTTQSGQKYIWTGPNNFLSTLQNPVIPNLNFQNSGIYRLELNISGCKIKDSVSVSVNESPQFVIEKANSYCLGGQVNIILKKQKTSSYAYYSWSTPLGNKGNVADGYFTLSNTTKADEGTYKFIANDYSGCTYTQTVEIKIQDVNCNTIVIEQPQKKLCWNTENRLNFSVKGNIDPDETFTIYRLDSYGIRTQLAQTKERFFVLKGNVFNYEKYIIEGTKQRVWSNILNVEYVNNNVYISSSQTKACYGFTIPLKIDSTFYRLNNIQWFFNDTPISNATKYTYIATKTGSYSFTGERDGCKVNTTKENKIDIKIGAIETPYIFNATTNHVCSGQVVKIVEKGSYYNMYNDKNYKYQWQLNGKNIENATNITFDAKETGMYTLKMSQGECEATSDKLPIFIGGLKRPELYTTFPKVNGAVNICDGFGLEITTYDYINYNQQKGEYLPIDGMVFQWEYNGKNLDLGATSPINKITVKEAGNYRLRVFQGDCLAYSEVITVKKADAHFLKFRNDFNSLCEGDSINFSVVDYGEYLYRYKWLDNSNLNVKLYKSGGYVKDVGYWESTSVAESGRYNAVATFNLEGSDKVCRVYSDTVDFQIKGKTINYKLASNNYISTCSDTLLLSGNAKNWRTAEYRWKQNNIYLKDTTSVLEVTQGGTYQVEATDKNGCVFQSEPFKVEFNKLEVAISKDDLSYCSNQKNSIYTQILSNERKYDFTFSWKLNDKSIADSSSYILLNASGKYEVTVKNRGCTATASTNVELIDLPRAITPIQDSLFICPNGFVNIEAPKADKYVWVFNNQSFQNNETQSIKAKEVGTYKVWLEKANCGFVSKPKYISTRNILPTATISGGGVVGSGDSTKIKIDLTSSAPWTAKLTNNTEFQIEKSPFEFAVRPAQSTVYELLSVKNTCGDGSVSGKAEVKIIILGEEEMADSKVIVSPNPAQVSCDLLVESVVPQLIDFQLLSQDGKLIQEVKSTQKELQFLHNIRLDYLPNGIYFLRIKVNNQVINRRIIKQN